MRQPFDMVKIFANSEETRTGNKLYNFLQQSITVLIMLSNSMSN